MAEVVGPLADGPLGGLQTDFVMVEWTDRNQSDADRPVAPLHVHHAGDEAWYVLEGRLGVRLGERIHTVDAGCAVIAEKGVPHTFWNAGDGPCRYLVVMTPEIHALIRALHQPGLDRSQIGSVFEAHRSQLL